MKISGHDTRYLITFPEQEYDALCHVYEVARFSSINTISFEDIALSGLDHIVDGTLKLAESKSSEEIMRRPLQICDVLNAAGVSDASGSVESGDREKAVSFKLSSSDEKVLFALASLTKSSINDIVRVSARLAVIDAHTNQTWQSKNLTYHDVKQAVTTSLKDRLFNFDIHDKE